MKYFALLVLMLVPPGWRLLTGVRDRNLALADGTAAYARGDADRAAWAFGRALAAHARRTPDPRLVLDLAHAQVRAGQRGAATATYGRLLAGSPARLSSVARQQLAVLAAQRGEPAQALGLLRQALLLDPTNAVARFNYEVLSDYLARRPSRPRLSPPLPSARKAPAPPENGGAQPKPAEKEGRDRLGEVNDRQPAPAPTTPPTQRPDANGQPDSRQPAPGTSSPAPGQRPAGTGTPRPLASGTESGSQRGLDRAADGRAGPARGSAAGTEAATNTDRNLQTQRERLRAMNLSPAQARQLLETLRAQEQQYLQQLARPAAQKPDPSQPTW